MFLWLICIARDHTKLMEWLNWTIVPWIERCHDWISRVFKLSNRAFQSRKNWNQWDTWLNSWDQDDSNTYLAKYFFLLCVYSLFFVQEIVEVKNPRYLILFYAEPRLKMMTCCHLVRGFELRALFFLFTAYLLFSHIISIVYPNNKDTR